MDRRLKIILAIMLASALVSGVVITGCSSPSPAQSPQVGKLAPDFELSGLDGQAVSLSALRGKPVLISFWATWCEPCRFEMPFIQEVYEGWTGKTPSLVILAINLGENPSRVERFMEEYGLSFPVLLDANQDVTEKYNIRVIPATFFIDKDGIIQDIKFGAFLSKAEIEMRLSKIIQ